MQPIVSCWPLGKSLKIFIYVGVEGSEPESEREGEEIGPEDFQRAFEF